MKFAKRVYYIAAVYGVLILTPMYFMETKNGLDFPPPINHPEYYYGFIGVALAWQFAFWLIGKDPVKYRLFMIPTFFEKFSYTAATVILFAQGRIYLPILITGLIDMVLGILFIAAFIKTRAAEKESASS